MAIATSGGVIILIQSHFYNFSLTAGSSSKTLNISRGTPSSQNSSYSDYCCLLLKKHLSSSVVFLPPNLLILLSHIIIGNNILRLQISQQMFVLCFVCSVALNGWIILGLRSDGIISSLCNSGVPGQIITQHILFGLV